MHAPVAPLPLLPIQTPLTALPFRAILLFAPPIHRVSAFSALPARAGGAGGCTARCLSPVIGSGPCKDRKSTRLNSSHLGISYAVFCLKKKIVFAKTQIGESTQPRNIS